MARAFAFEGLGGSTAHSAGRLVAKAGIKDGAEAGDADLPESARSD